MKIFITALFALAVLAGGGCSKDSDGGMLSDSEIVSAMEGRWVKTFEIKRVLLDGLLWTTTVRGVSGTVEGVFALDGIFRQWDVVKKQWLEDAHFAVRDGQLFVGDTCYGRISFTEEGNVMLWIIEKQNNLYRPEMTERFEIHWERGSMATLPLP